MLCRAKVSSVSQVGLDAATTSVLFFVTGGVSFCSGVDAPEVLDSEPKVTPPSLVYTLSDLTSGRGVDHTARFEGLAKAIAALPGATLLLDGEVAVFDHRLISRFDLLSDPDPNQLATPPVYMAFDVLYARGRDLRMLPLRERRAILERLERDAAPVFAVPRISSDGYEAWREVERGA